MLSTGPGAAGLERLASFLLRSETIASSLIEGIAPSSQQVALAELSQAESVRGFSDQDRLVANNITILRTAACELVTTDVVPVADVEALHRVLLPEERHHGLRQVQNWIGGSSWHPLDAQYVPPPAEPVRPLMEDLLAYPNGSVHAPLVQTATVHAQFETIHPFTDGNGRVGRALIHTVLTWRGLTPSAVLPVSLVLATMTDTYVAGLTAYRYQSDPTAAQAHAGVATWLEVFLDATATAATQAHLFADQVGALTRQWEQQVNDHRARQGVRATPRAASVSSRLLPVLPEVPILTARTRPAAAPRLFPPARAGLEELAAAGVLSHRRVEQGTTRLHRERAVPRARARRTATGQHPLGHPLHATVTTSPGPTRPGLTSTPPTATRFDERCPATARRACIVGVSRRSRDQPAMSDVCPPRFTESAWACTCRAPQNSQATRTRSGLP